MEISTTTYAPLVNLDHQQKKEYCIKHGINAHALITGQGELTLGKNSQFGWCKRTALALNAVMLTHFTDLPTFYKTFNIDATFINMLWAGTIVPRKSIVTHLTQIYEVNTIYIFRPEVKTSTIFTTDLVLA